jgi:hypothetical protein
MFVSNNFEYKKWKTVIMEGNVIGIETKGWQDFWLIFTHIAMKLMKNGYTWDEVIRIFDNRIGSSLKPFVMKEWKNYFENRMTYYDEEIWTTISSNWTSDVEECIDLLPLKLFHEDSKETEMKKLEIKHNDCDLNLRELDMDWFKMNELIKEDVDYDYCYWRKQQMERKLAEEDLKYDLMKRTLQSVSKVSYDPGEQQQVLTGYAKRYEDIKFSRPVNEEEVKTTKC